MKLLLFLPFTVVLGFFLFPASSAAQTTNVISYQGMLKDAQGNPENGLLNITFRLYDQESGGTPLWAESHDDLTVVDGLFSVVLGEQAPTLGSLPYDKPYWLQLEVNGTPLQPRTRMTAVPTAHRSCMADNVPEGTIGPGHLDANGAAPMDGQVLSYDKTADAFEWKFISGGGGSGIIALAEGDGISIDENQGPVTTIGLAAEGVETGHLADDAVTADKIADAAVIGIKLADGAVAGQHIVDGAVGTEKIEDGAITQDKISSDVVFPLEGDAGGDLAGAYPDPVLADTVITTSKLKDQAVTSAKIMDQTILGHDINGGAQLSIATVTTTGGASIGTTDAGSQVVIKGTGLTGATSALNVTDNADNSLLYVQDNGNVGIGSTAPAAGLEISKVAGTGLHVSSGGTVLSVAVLRAGAALPIPANTSVVQIRSDGVPGSPNNVLMPPPGVPGELLIIINDDLDPTAGGVTLGPGQSAMFVTTPFPAPAWRRIN